jgi:hypothetical protein
MSKTLRHYIREVLEVINDGKKSFQMDVMQIGDAEYSATLAKYPAAARAFRDYNAAFERARTNRISYLERNFAARLEELGAHAGLSDIDTQRVRDMMIDSVKAAKLKILKYPDDVDSKLTVNPSSGNLVYNSQDAIWNDLTKHINKSSALAFAYGGNVFVPPPVLIFDVNRQLTGAVIYEENPIDLLEHELEHVEVDALEKLDPALSGLVNPANLSRDLVTDNLVPPEELALDKLMPIVEAVPELSFNFSSDPVINKAANCAYLAYLPFSVTRGKDKRYGDAAIKIAEATKIPADTWDILINLAVDHGTPDHVRMSLLAMRNALISASFDGSQPDRMQMLTTVAGVLKRAVRSDQMKRSLALLVITNPAKYDDLTLVAAADSPTTLNRG